MSSQESSVNGTMVAVLASVGLPLAVVGVVTSVIALNMSNGSQQAVAKLEASAEIAQNQVVQDLAGQISEKATQEAEGSLRILAGDQVAGVKGDLEALIEEQGQRIELLESALADATATIQAVQPEASSRDVTSFGVYSAEAYQELAAIGVNWEETKGTDFVIQAVERSAPATVAPSTPQPAADVAEMSMGDPDAGKRKFSQCSSCHTVNEGGRNGIGPNLWGVYEAELAAKDGFRYSTALLEFGGSWTPDQLDQYLANPRGYIRGTKMGFAGLRKEEERANVIAYLATLN